MTPSDFAAFVALMKERGVSQKQLAALLGIDETRVGNYRQRLPPSQAKIIALACAAIAADLPPWTAAAVTPADA